jgi:hypothetical protein
MTSPTRFVSVMLLPLGTLLIPTVIHAQGGGSAIAENLIRAMRLDQFALQGAHASCVVFALANVLARQVSPGEMQEALAFHSNFAGKKALETQIAIYQGSQLIAVACSQAVGLAQ